MDAEQIVDAATLYRLEALEYRLIGSANDEIAKLQANIKRRHGKIEEYRARIRKLPPDVRLKAEEIVAGDPA